MELSSLDITLWSSAFTAFGFLIGNRLALGRDKRKEFNKIVNPLYVDMRNQIDHGSKFIEIKTDQWSVLERYIPSYKRRRFRRCIKIYQDSKMGLSDYDPKTGIYTYDDLRLKAHIIASKKLLKYLRPK